MFGGMTQTSASPTPLPPAMLPAPVAAWFARRGWTAHPHQLAVLAAAAAGRSALLVAPTGGGKTLAGFLPRLIELAARPTEALHTLYVSPLKALAVDVKRNLEIPLADLAPGLRAETRTGDTPAAKRARQRTVPPQILMTTPESLALMLADPAARTQFAGLRSVVVDELHALEGSKRGDLLALGLARLATLAPQARRVGLSATIADPSRLARWLGAGLDADPVVLRGRGGARPDIRIVLPEARLPWGGHMALNSMPEVYGALRGARSAIVFVNTRAQAELCFQELWKLNEDRLAIAMHHGSLAVEQRRKVEAAMAEGRLRAVVATASLDLGIDWGDVDLVVQVGAPKGAARLLQRIGRSNHRLDVPSRALLVPANRFEVLECEAAIEAIDAGELDAPRERPGGLDVLAQHLLGCACHGPVDAEALYAEVRRAAPYAALARRDFDDVLAFVATGGYALKGYDRFRRLFRASDGTWRIVGPAVARQYRLNIGTIVEAPMVTLMLNRRRKLGEVEEWFAQGLEIGDTFMFGGQLLRFEGMRGAIVDVGAARSGEPKVPVYEGGRLPLTTELAARVRALLAEPGRWDGLPAPVRDWLRLQRAVSVAPRRDGLLVEIFPRGGKMFLVAYCFEGRYAHQTLGMLLTRRMERAGARPLGFVATDYAIAVWSLRPPQDVGALFAEDMLGDDLEEWMAESSMLRRTFRNVAIVAGLIERRHPGAEKSGRQVTFGADLIYDVLRRHEPDHVLLRATRAEAASGMTDIARLGAFLARIRGRIDVERLDRVSPLAVPVLLEIGRESVRGGAIDELLDEAARALIEDAGAPPAEPRQRQLL
jgi:ATP-dependent Lhr-like helicase